MRTSSQEWKLSNMTPSSSDYFILSFSSSLFPSASGSFNQQNETASCLTHSFLLSSWPEWFRQGHTPSPAEAPLMDKHRKESKHTHKKITGHMKRQNCSKRGDQVPSNKIELLQEDFSRLFIQVIRRNQRLWLPFPETSLSWSVSFLFLSKPHYDSI